MPAKHLLRIDEDGIYSHIYNRAVENRLIFNDEEDYKVFLGFLEEYLTPQDPSSSKKTFKVHGRTFQGIPHQPKNYFERVELIAYDLMPDHFHLLLHQLTKGSIENFIRSLCTRYSIYFNRKYQRTGALFEGPYKSVQIKDELRLSHLSRFFHHNTGDYTSYPEYLGLKNTSWVKPQVVLSLFDKGRGSYKDFVEKALDQKEKELIDDITFESEIQHLERRNLASKEETPDPDLKPHSRIPDFLAISAALFLLLVTMGIGNIKLSTAKSYQPLPTTVPDVLSETKETKSETIPEATSETTPETLPETEPVSIVTVKINDDSSYVNIREQPTTASPKIGQAKDGDTYEVISKPPGWFEVKLSTASGFISTKYIKEAQ